MAAAKQTSRKRYRKGDLLKRKRGPRYREVVRSLMQSLIAERHAQARKLDRKAYDTYHADLYLRLFPNA